MYVRRSYSRPQLAESAQNTAVPCVAIFAKKSAAPSVFATAEGEAPVQVCTGSICIRITRSQTSGHLAQCMLLSPANTLRRLSDGNRGNEYAANASFKCAATVHAKSRPSAPPPPFLVLLLLLLWTPSLEIGDEMCRCADC